MVEIKINREEALRYLGGSGLEPDEKMLSLLDSCEKELLGAASPMFLYKRIDINESGLILGEDVGNHLEGCKLAYVMCATLGSAVDKIIRAAQVSDMARAVVLDSTASAAIESLCDEVEAQISRENEGSFLTWRFSPGYGDYPLSLQEKFLALLDAPRKIGLCSSDSFLLTPAKSVTAILGVSEKPLEKKRRGCAVCALSKTCKFRKAGTRCEF